MAEVAANLVIDKCVPSLLKEAKRFKRVRKEVMVFKDELISIQAFLRDADGQAEKNNGVKTWVEQVQNVSYRIEDVIDESTLHFAEHSLFRRFIDAYERVKWRYEIGNEIQAIKASIREIWERREKYSFNSLERGTSSGVAWEDHQLAPPFTEEADIVGIEGPKRQLISWLVEGELKRTVYPLVGMGGLGKTTLAKKVFDSQEVKGYFDYSAWITASQFYDREEIGRDMMKQFCKARKKEYALEGIDSIKGLPDLVEYLQQKRYLVVLDDVWTIECWRSIESALPNNQNGSRIVITTRNGDVASSCVEDSTHVFKLKPLPQDSAWKLFCNKVFQSNDCPRELQSLSNDIVRKCEGLPLAIVVIGGLLKTKSKVAFQWKIFRNSLQSELERNPQLTRITRILSLSYHDMRYELKSCFLYLGMFPEDYSVRCVRLVRLWIAEGFVKETKGKTLEDVAEEYLNELIQRSLVQISSVDFDGRPRTCHVHDLMREMLLSKYDELNFCRVLREKDTNYDGPIRRLALSNFKENIPEGTNFSKVRSIFVFEVNGLGKKLTDSFFTNYRLLKVLDFEDAHLENVPQGLGNLFHLRYLSFRNTKVRMLPKSIAKLHNLETLDLKRSLVKELPIEILELPKLRHLLVYCYQPEVGYLEGVKIPLGIGSLQALQKLYFMEADGDDRLVTELGQLIHLRKLGITKLTRQNGRALCTAVENMSGLLAFSVTSINREELLDLQLIDRPPRYLQRLYLHGRLQKLPNWISKLHSLMRLRLSWSGLSEDPLKHLQALPNLLELGLWQAYDGDCLHFVANEFPKIKILRLGEMNNLSLIYIELEALPLLEVLHITSCPQLKEVPSGIQYLENLKTIEFVGMPTEFEYSMQQEFGTDQWKVTKYKSTVTYQRIPTEEFTR